MSTAPGEGMRKPASIACLAVSTSLLFATHASAQRAEAPAPIGCFRIVENRGVASQTGLDLCAGASTDAPGACYAAALDINVLSSQQMLQLCTRATSLDPLQCYKLLDDRGDLTNDQIIRYCAATCPVGPPPAQSADPWCVEDALERTSLTTQMVGELCRASRSAEPVACYVAGAATSALTESQLVSLCAETWSCQYVNAPPT